MKRILAAGLILFAFSFGNINVEGFHVNLEDSMQDISAEDLGVPVIAEPEPVVVKANLHKVTKKWTVMVFINGKNNLEGAGLFNINQMESIGSNRHMNVVVETGRMKGQEGDTDLDGDWTGNRRLYIKKDSNDEKITSQIVMKQKNVDMGDYKRIANFVKWAKANYPAKRYMLIIWNHGTGFFDPIRSDKGVPGKGISFDDETGNYVRTMQIGKIFKEAGKVDVLGFDACLMQMAEVAFEVKDYADVIVGSEETVPGLGFPYDRILNTIKEKPSISAEDLGSDMVDHLKDFYKGYKDGVTFSAIRASKLDEFAERLSSFVSLAKEVDDKNAIRKARARVLRYDVLGGSDPRKKISFSGDINHFIKIMLSNVRKREDKAQTLKDEMRALRKFIAKDLMINVQSEGKERTSRLLKDSGGIAVYFPPVEKSIAQKNIEGVFENKYQDFYFNKVSGWYDFVTYMYDVK